MKLFYDLPCYSEDIHYDFLPGVSPQKLMDIIKNLFTKRRWEITDEALKYYTLLFELRFAGPERNFRVKIEISTREKELKTVIMPLRGVPVLTLEPSFLMTEKLLTFVDRQAGRDIFDAWFILKNAYPLDKAMVEKGFGNRANFYQTLLNRIEKADPNKIVRDTGKLLKEDYRNWIRTSFLSDFKQLVSSELSALNG